MLLADRERTEVAPLYFLDHQKISRNMVAAMRAMAKTLRSARGEGAVPSFA